MKEHNAKPPRHKRDSTFAALALSHLNKACKTWGAVPHHLIDEKQKFRGPSLKWQLAMRRKEPRGRQEWKRQKCLNLNKFQGLLASSVMDLLACYIMLWFGHGLSWFFPRLSRLRCQHQSPTYVFAVYDLRDLWNFQSGKMSHRHRENGLIMF